MSHPPNYYEVAAEVRRESRIERHPEETEEDFAGRKRAQLEELVAATANAYKQRVRAYCSELERELLAQLDGGRTAVYGDMDHWMEDANADGEEVHPELLRSCQERDGAPQPSKETPLPPRTRSRSKREAEEKGKAGPQGGKGVSCRPSQPALPEAVVASTAGPSGEREHSAKRRRQTSEETVTPTSIIPTESEESEDDESGSGSTWEEVKPKKRSPKTRSRAHGCGTSCCRGTNRPSHGAPLQVPEFSGDPLEFSRFLRIFREAVERQTSCPDARFTHLQAVCKGEASHLIAHLGSVRPEVAYKEAMKRLKQKYGREKVVADAWVARLRRKEYQGTREYGLDLRTAYEALKDLGFLHTVNNETTVDLLADRLPDRLKEDWEEKAVSLEADGDVTFRDFVEFVERRGEKRKRAPVGGKIGSKAASSTRTTERAHKPASKSQKVLATRAESPEERRRSYRDVLCSPSPVHSYATREEDEDVCGVCDGGHFIGCCPKVLKASPKVRRELMSRAGVCFVCLELGHSARTCTKKMWCEVAGCRRRHHTILHVDEDQANPSRNGNQRRRERPYKAGKGTRRKQRSPTPSASASTSADSSGGRRA